MTNIVADQAKLVLNTFAAIFENNLVSKDLVTWRKFDGEMNDRNKLTVVEQVGAQYDVVHTSNGVADLSAGVQDSVFGSEQYSIDGSWNTSMGYSDWQKIRDFESARENEGLRNAAIRMAHKIDGEILRVATLASNNWTGTVGAAIQDFDDVASGFTRLKEEGVEDPELRAVLTYGDKQALGSAVVSDNASLTDIGAGIYREGFSGSVAGVPTLFTQQLPTMTTGTRTNGAINGANQNEDYKDVAISTAPGNYKTQLLNVDGLGASATVKDGEIFTIDGVFDYDERLGAVIPRLKQFRVIGDHTATAGGVIANLRIYPAIIVPGTGSGGDIAVNRANATVSAIPADNAVITWAGAASTALKPRLLMNKSAIIVNTKNLIMPFTGQGTTVSLKNVPLQVRLWKDSEFATGEHRIRFDVVATVNVAAEGRRRITRVSGS